MPLDIINMEQITLKIYHFKNRYVGISLQVTFNALCYC